MVAHERTGEQARLNKVALAPARRACRSVVTLRSDQGYVGPSRVRKVDAFDRDRLLRFHVGIYGRNAVQPAQPL